MTSLAAYAGWLLLSGACDRQATSPRAASSASVAAPAGLVETYEQLRGDHARGAYQSMRPYIDPQHREDVIDLLVAVDELLAANTGAQEAIRRACPTVAAERFDLSMVADNLELFSRDARLIRAEEQGDRGTVTVQIADRVPLVHLRFERRQGRWIYLPGQWDAPIIPTVREVAGALNRIAVVVSSGPRAPEDIESEYRFRIGPKLRQVRGE